MYIDSNVFIFATLDEGDLGGDCSKLLEMIAERRILCASSFLTLDEVLYILNKKIPKEDALKVTKSILSMPIRWIEVNLAVTIGMIENVDNDNLKPRDAVHLASMRLQGIDTIVSEDTDFDGIKGIKRISASDSIKN